MNRDYRMKRMFLYLKKKKSEWGHRESSGVRKLASSIVNMLCIQWSSQEAAGFAGQPEAEAEDRDVGIFNIQGAAEAMGWKACLKMSATLLWGGPSEGPRDCKEV